MARSEQLPVTLKKKWLLTVMSLVLGNSVTAAQAESIILDRFLLSEPTVPTASPAPRVATPDPVPAPKAVEPTPTPTLNAVEPASTPSHTASVASPSVAAETEAEIITLNLSLRLGDVRSSGMSLDGRTLYVWLTENAVLSEWRDIAARITRDLPFAEAARVQDIAGDTYLIVELSRPLVLLDEAVSIVDMERMSWELTFRERRLADTGSVGLAEIVPEGALQSVRVLQQGPLVTLEFSGSSEFFAEIYYHDGRDALIVEFPGDSVRAVRRLLPDDLPSALGEVVVETSDVGRARLVIPGAPHIDLVDAIASADDTLESSRLSLYLVPDAPIRADLAQGRLDELNLDTSTGLDVLLDGPRDARINAYLLPSPSRFMLDLLGVSVDEAERAIRDFNPDGQYVAGIRFGETQLGSTRIELTLTEAYADAMGTDVIPFRRVLEPNTIALALPEAGRPLPQVDTEPLQLPGRALAEALNLRAPPDVELLGEPAQVIGSIRLDAAFYEDRDHSPMPIVTDRFSLMGSFLKALDSDPSYLAALAEFRINAEALPQARAGLLPTLDFNYQFANIQQDVRASGTLDLGRTRYNSNLASLNLTQPVFRASAFVAVNQARLAVEQAQLAVLVSEQELMVRLATIYLNVLLATDELQLAQSELDAFTGQFELANTRFRAGIADLAEYNDSLSRMTIAEARYIKAENTLDDARLAFKEIVGEEIGILSGFQGDFRAALPFPAAVEPWIDAALEQNLALQTRQLATRIADLQVRRQRAERLPTLDFVATVRRSSDDQTLFSPERQELDAAEASLRLNMPLYGGGRPSSLIREASARRDRESQLAERERRKSERDVRSAFLGVNASARMLDALREAVRAEQVRLETRLQGFESGVESQVAVLDAYQQYFSVRRDFAQARFDYLINRLSLKQAVGTLSRADLSELDRLLVN